ncbi:MAG: hypothetical protein QG632_338 [Candidatus Dependentiae bacterium]|nr:hypothetical protein [Candidatus Dependentiae bacterium]
MNKKYILFLLLCSAICLQVSGMSVDEFMKAMDFPAGTVYEKLNQAIVREQYQARAKVLHPDKKDGSLLQETSEREELFKKLSAAHQAYPDGIGGAVEDDKGAFKAAYDNPANYHDSYADLMNNITDRDDSGSQKATRSERDKLRAERNKAWVPLTIDERLKRMREQNDLDFTTDKQKTKNRSTISKILDFQPQIALDAADLATFTSADGRLLGLGSAASVAGRFADVFAGRNQARDALTQKQHDILRRRAKPGSKDEAFNRAAEGTQAEYRDASAVAGAQKTVKVLDSIDRQWGQGSIAALEHANTALNAQTLLAYNKHLAESKDEIATKEYMKEWHKKRRRAWIMMALEAALKNGALLLHTQRETDPNVSTPSEADANKVKGANALAASGALLGLVRKLYGGYIKNDHISQAQAHAEQLYQVQQPQS